MAKNLERYDKLVIVVLIIAVLVLGIGYWFAQEKSEPVYLSKIDRLMFDKNNKSPAYILTLPDNIEVSEHKDNLSDLDFDNQLNKTPIKEENKEKDFSLEKLIVDMPSISKLPNKSYPITMKNIEIIPDLIEETEEGMVLPKQGANGHRAWIEYGNAVNTLPNFKKIAIVISNLGFDSFVVSKIASAFPPELSLSFHPYSTHEEDDIKAARQKGHETYVDLILASSNFLREDTGPMSLNFDLSKDELFSRFYQTIAKKAPIGGVVIRDGDIDENNKPMINELLEEIKLRGLLMVDATSSEIINTVKVDGLARRKADIVINRDMLSNQIDEQLKKAENIAFDKGQILIVSDNNPLAVVHLSKWIETFSPQLSYEESKAVDINKPFALVPVSNLVVE